MKTFLQYIEHRDVNEAFFDKMKQGFQASYQSAKGDEKENASQTDEQYKKAGEYAVKAIDYLKTRKSYIDKMGVSLPFAATIVAAGMTGGLAAIPFAVLSKKVADIITHQASKGFDKVADMTFGKKPAMAESSFVDRTGKMISGAVDRTGKMISGAVDRTGKVISGAVDKTGGAIGSTAGFIAGKSSKYYSKLTTLLQKAMTDLLSFVKNNKRDLAKAAFLYAIGTIMGGAIGMASNKVYEAEFWNTNNLNEMIPPIAAAGVDQSELISFVKDVGNEVIQGNVEKGFHAAHGVEALMPHVPNSLVNALPSFKNAAQASQEI